MHSPPVRPDASVLAAMVHQTRPARQHIDYSLEWWAAIQFYVFSPIFFSTIVFANVQWHTFCDALQHTATHCNTLKHTATHCNTLFTVCWYITSTEVVHRPRSESPLHFNIPAHRRESVAVCCSVLQCVSVCCSVLQCVAVERYDSWHTSTP